jgi:hypothetical protein
MQETFPGLYDDWDYCIGTLSYVILYSGGESAKSNEFLNLIMLVCNVCLLTYSSKLMLVYTPWEMSLWLERNIRVLTNFLPCLWFCRKIKMDFEQLERAGL